MADSVYTLDDPIVDIAIEEFLSRYRDEETWNEMRAWLDGAEAAAYMTTVASEDPRTVQAVDRLWKRIGLMLMAGAKGVAEAEIEAMAEHYRSLPEIERLRSDLAAIKSAESMYLAEEPFGYRRLVKRLEKEIRDLEESGE